MKTRPPRCRINRSARWNTSECPTAGEVKMGEARRRRLAQDQRERLSAVSVPNDIRQDIASIVNRFFFACEGGHCMRRALITLYVLNKCGFDARLRGGSMLFRAGPDPCRDVVAFCGPGNRAYWID